MHHDQSGFRQGQTGSGQAGSGQAGSGQADADTLNRVAQSASALGGEIVDVAGFLDQLEEQTDEQLRTLRGLREGAGHVVQINASVMETLTAMSETITATLNKLTEANDLLQDTEEKSAHITTWVQSLDDRSQSVQGTLDAVQSSNNQIADIA
ncbi:MAG: hypothetical protein VYA97_11065, partial [Pseudomonadota bacterium]|nr:hypothetical protein [Pseudomonadota bacterium]